MTFIFHNHFSYIIMLPKLQQSSIAQSLRRDNPANHNYSTYMLIQMRINSKTSLATPTMKTINPGRITTPPKIHIHPLEISPPIMYPRTSSKIKLTSPITKAPSQDLYPSKKEKEELEECAPPPLKRKKASKSPSLSVEPSKREMFLLQNSEDIMIVEIYPSALTTKAPVLNFCGKYQPKL